MAGNRAGFLKIPVVQAAFNLIKIQGIFYRELRRFFRTGAFKNRNALFTVKVMGKRLDRFGNSRLECFRGLVKGADPGKDLRRTEGFYNTGDFPAVFQNVFRNGSAGLCLEIDIQDQIVITVTVGILFFLDHDLFQG